MTSNRLLPVFLLAACGSSSASVPVKGKESDVVLLAGKWVGEYEGRESGRRGSIRFDLALGYHVAEGEVIMRPAGDAAAEVPLQIKFVNVGEHRVSGKIAPYTDPACKCAVETEFSGRVEGGTMDGTFVTRGAGIAEQTGRWSAQRTADK